MPHVKISLTSSLLLPLAACASSSHTGTAISPISQTSPLPPIYSPDNDDGTYKNPILFADYSDPDVIRVDNDFYMTASSFSCFPGLPILHSRDLVHWTLVAHAVDRYPEPYADFFNAPQHGNGIWAPALRFHDHTFFIFFGDPDHGIFMTTAKDAAGPWSPLHLVKEAKGWIDTCPFWDDDGHAYLIHAYARSRSGINNRLDICKMAPDGSRLLDDGTIVYNGGNDPLLPRPAGTPTDGRYTTVEGPKLYKRNGYYYIFAPGGGVTNGYQIAFRSQKILGPYQSRIVLDQGNTSINGPHQGGWVTTSEIGGHQEDWFIHFQDRGPYGRITHLQPMHWVNDWPVIGEDPQNTGIGHPAFVSKKPIVSPNPSGKSTGQSEILVPQTSDEFNLPTLGLQWQWFANYQRDWVNLSARLGFLRLSAVALPISTPLYNRPNLLLQKLPAESFTATTRLDVLGLREGESAGLVMVGRTTASLTVRRTAAGFQIARTHFQFATRVNAIQPPDADQVSTKLTIDENSPLVELRVHVAPGARCTFFYSLDGQKFIPLGESFAAAADQWIGAKVGIFCNAPPPVANPAVAAPNSASGYADFDYFRFQ